MTTQQLKDLVATGDMKKCMSILETNAIIKNLHDSLKQYEPKKHDVFDKTKRPDKVVKDEEGNLKTIKVNRIPLPIQKKIVLVSAAFLGTPTIESSPSSDLDKNFLMLIKKIWDDNKLDYKFKKIAKMVMSEKHCAELWYTLEAEQTTTVSGIQIPGYWNGFPISQSAKYKMGMKLLSNSLGDDLYPVFDEFGNMIAFGRGYKLKNEEEKEIEHFDLYTSDKIYFTKNENSVWLFGNGTEYSNDFKDGVPNVLGKIPVIYYSQPITEWDDVQELIDRLENKISNHADTNDYYDSPIVFAEGNVKGFADKGEQGKLLIGENGAKVSYLTWDSAPESMRMEIENLLKFIHSYTHTPDISFEQMKGLGVFSGIALKMLFLDAHLKAADKEEIFGESMQRRINFLKVVLTKIDGRYVASLPLSIKPKFEYFLPKDINESIDILVKAVSGGILSNDSAIRQNPLVIDADEEIKAIKKSKAINGIELESIKKQSFLNDGN